MIITPTWIHSFICNTVKYTMGRAADDASPTDNSTYSCTGDDSGFSDSRAFLKESPPTSPQHTSAQTECAFGLDVSYTSLIAADVLGAEYYKTLGRESIQGILPIRHFLIGLIILF